MSELAKPHRYSSIFVFLTLALLGGIAATALLTTPAIAQTIDTTTSWNGSDSNAPWGVPDSATYGQTITPTAQQTFLTSFTFELRQVAGGDVQYQAFVYQWDSANRQITGPALFSSPVLTAPVAAGFVPVTIDTGSVQLLPGQQYVLFFTTSTVSGQSDGVYAFGAVDDAVYPDGTWVFSNNGTDFDLLSVPFSWFDFFDDDLAFIAMFGPGALVPLLPANAPVNPTNVGTAIDNFVAGGGILPNSFSELYSLSGRELTSALTQLDGEVNTQSQQGAFQLMNTFMAMLTNPIADNRGGERYGAVPLPTSDQANGKLGPPIDRLGPRIWGAVYGSTNETDGNTHIGSTDLTSRAGGVAGGADFRLSPSTVVGFALAGGGTSWSLSRLGNGESDAFQGGLYASHAFNQFYVTGAVVGAEYWASTERKVSVDGTDHLTANFDAQSFGGRIEGGYHFEIATGVITPYAAVQAQEYNQPGYREHATAGSSDFALRYNSNAATATRLELGSWASRDFVLPNGGGILSLFGRLAWAQDDESDPRLRATFIELPANFIVNGAGQSGGLALVTAGAEFHLREGIALLAKFDGEFANGDQTYAGTARLRYTW